MKYKLILGAAACALAFLTAGCYTEFATHDTSDRGYAGDDNDEYVTSDNDSTDSGAATDEYFGDDAYRYSRFHTSFGFYYPWRWGYYTTVYDPWFDDPWYWSDGWRPYVLWPYPTWYPYYGGYYGHHYWGYYDGPGYYGGGWYGGGGGSGLPHRTRTMGTTREDRFGIRSRSPIATPAGSYTPGGTNQTGVRTRGGSSDERRGVTTPTAPTRTRSNDTPWWERLNQDERRTRQAEQPAAGTQTERTRRRQVEQGASSGASTQTRPAAPGSTTDRPRYERPRQERRERGQSTERSGGRQAQPRYSPPSNNGGGGRERSSGGSAPSGRTSSSGGSQSNGGSRTRSGR